MLVSKITVVVWAWAFLWSYLYVPPNLAASLDATKRSDVMTVSKKERRYSYLYQPPSEIRPLAVAGVRCF